MRKLALAALVAGAMLGVAAPASARCPEFNLRCTIDCAVPHFDPEHGLEPQWYYC